MRDRKWRKDNPKAQGSFTVEAALVLPIIIICIFYFLDQGIELYCQIVELVGNPGIWESFDPASRFRQLELIRDIIN